MSGVVDLEVASAGDPVEDLIKFAIEMAAMRPSVPRWWEMLFAGYGGAPDFGRFRLRWLGAEGVEFWCQGWEGARADMIASFLAADTWADLFTAGDARNAASVPG